VNDGLRFGQTRRSVVWPDVTVGIWVEQAEHPDQRLDRGDALLRGKPELELIPAVVELAEHVAQVRAGLIGHDDRDEDRLDGLERVVPGVRCVRVTSVRAGPSLLELDARRVAG
jgi:hypothetical protein